MTDENLNPNATQCSQQLGCRTHQAHAAATAEGKTAASDALVRKVTGALKLQRLPLSLRDEF